MHFPVSLLKDSPTAMGLISGGLPSFSLINVPPAKNLATIGGAFPEARRFTMSLRVAHMGVAIGIRAASSKCCMRSPDGTRCSAFWERAKSRQDIKARSNRNRNSIHIRGYRGRTAWVLRLQQLPGGIIVGG